MARFTKESLESLKQRIHLVDVISSYTELKRAGASYKGLCPFHDEKTPSFTIQAGDGNYHCYGCGAHGDAIQFLMEYLGLSFLESVDQLAERFHVHLEIVENQENQEKFGRKRMREVLAYAARFYHFYLLHTEEGHQALEYLYNRGIDLQMMRQFQIGLSPGRGGIFYSLMQHQKWDTELLEEVGLLRRGQTGQRREFFNERIMFPIKDGVGHVIGFSARKYKEHTFGGKYVNTAETPLFKKSKLLYGFHSCRRRIAKEQKVLIVEGQIDAMRLICEGFNFTVTPQGTAFGEEQAKQLIQLGVKEVYLALDADTAGKTASSKIGNFFQKEGIEVKILELPLGMDPDSILLEQGSEAFLHMIESATDFLSFLVNFYSETLDTRSPAGKSQMVVKVLEQVRSWDNDLMEHESLKKLATLTGVPESVIGIDVPLTSRVYIQKVGQLNMSHIDPDQILEMDLLRWLLLLGNQEGDYLTLIRANLKVEYLKSEVCREIFKAYLQLITMGESVDLLTLTANIQHAEAQSILDKIFQKKVNREKGKEQLIETIRKILEKNWMEKKERIKLKIHSGQESEEEALILLKEFGELQKQPPKVLIPAGCIG